LKSKSDWLAEAQREFNLYVRVRDAGMPCISCQKPPKKKNAGHYKSVGAYPELRFHPFNNNLQCEHCNSWKSGDPIRYRQNLIKKIGEPNVLWLEGRHEIQHLTIDDIKEIKQYYKEQTKILIKER
jgi:MoaA/NifB/PqqE/SkfB family radical SAM enzyme